MNRIKVKLILLAILCCAFYSCDDSKKVTGTKGTVNEVINGNTIRLANGLKVRLIGIANEPRSEDFLKSSVLNKKVRLLADSQDRKQTWRTAKKETVRAYVRVMGGENIALNGFMLRNKFAHLNTEFLKDSVQWVDKKLISEKLTFEQLSHLMTPATFLIQTNEGVGTGFFINEKGLALTNHHVLDGSQQATVYLSDVNGHLSDAEYRYVDRILFTNPDFDFTIFTVKCDNGEKFPYLTLSDGELERGMSVGVVGNPLGQEMTFTTGHVSRFIEDKGAFQFDASVQHGSSGGPIANERGYAVGIVKALLNQTAMTNSSMTTGNFNFAVDIRVVRQALNYLDQDYAGK